MRVQRVSAYALTTALVLCIATLVGVARMSQAQPTEAPSPSAMAQPTPHAPHASQLVKVSHCSAKLNVMQSGGWGPGYVPGWGYRGGYWGDAYGYNYYQAPVTTTDPQLAIDYVNVSPETMNDIEFGLVVNGVLRAEVKDVGTFSPGTEIKHKFGISPNVFPLQTSLEQCVPLRITFANGKKWRNPGLPPKNQHIYYNP
jgi:hypothetical protein